MDLWILHDPQATAASAALRLGHCGLSCSPPLCPQPHARLAASVSTVKAVFLTGIVFLTAVGFYLIVIYVPVYFQAMNE